MKSVKSPGKQKKKITTVTGPDPEEALRESEAQLNAIIRASPVPMFVIDNSHQVISWNKALENTSGIEARTVLGTRMHWKAFYKAERPCLADLLLDRYPEKIPELYAGKWKKSDIVEGAVEATDFFPHLGTGGKWLHFIAAPVIDSHGNLIGAMETLEDITGHVQARQELEASEERFRGITERISDLIFIVDTEGYPTFMSPSVTAILGFPPESYIGKRSGPDIIHQEDIVKIGKVMESLKDGSPEERVEFRMLKRDGSFAVFDGTGIPVFIHGIYSGVQIVARDITERKRAEEKLHESEERYRSVIENAAEGIAVAQDGTLQYANSQLLDMIQTDPTGITGHPLTEFIHPDDRAFVLDRFQHRVPGENVPQHYDFRVVGTRGKVTWVQISAVRIEWNGRSATLNFLMDITDRKQAEEKLRESRQILEGILNTIPVRVFWKDSNLIYLGCNTPFARDAGFEKPQDIIGKDDYSMGWREQAESYRADDRAVIVSGKPKLMIEEPQTTPTGETIYLYTNKLPLLDARGNGIGVLGTYLDVTERKHAEEVVRESRQLFMDIISFLPDPTFVIDRDGKVLAWNRALEQISGVPAGDIIGKGDHEYSLWQYGKRRPILIDLVLHPEEAAGRLDYADIVSDGRSVTAQAEITRPGGGHKISLSAVASPLIDLQGRITGAIESMRDISHIKETEAELARINENLEKIVRDRTKELEDEVVVRKQAEAAIQASLDEKVILLREIHHRVKNNLQIIISLVNLQMRQTDDPGVKQIMAETQNRVRAMSLVHEKLYRSESLSRIDFADYTRFLATQLFSFFGMDSKRVRLDLAIGKIMVDINTAVPLGLLMNELISNALKHAFPDGREGTISISGGENSDLITLVVRDNGIGIPEELDWKNTKSLGMRLVTGLIDQINGTITLDRNQGTAFTITIRREPATGDEG